MDLHLAGKTAVVTGGSRGIGLEIVRTLLAEGMHVVSGSRTVTAALKETDAMAVTVDLSTSDGSAHLIAAAVSALGGIDLVVNNVGVGDTNDVIQGALRNLVDLPTRPGSTPSRSTSTAPCGPVVPPSPASSSVTAPSSTFHLPVLVWSAPDRSTTT